MQILTMEYVPGIKINKIQALDQLGLDRKRLVSSEFLQAKLLLAFYIILMCISTTDYGI